MRARAAPVEEPDDGVCADREELVATRPSEHKAASK